MKFISRRATLVKVVFDSGVKPDLRSNLRLQFLQGKDRNLDSQQFGEVGP